VAVLVRAERRTPTERVLGWLLDAAAVEFAVVAVTGMYLAFFYHPASRGMIDDVRLLHRDTAGLLIVTLWVFLVVASGFWLGRGNRRNRWRQIVTPLAAGIVVVALLGSFSGYRISWGQLALWQGTFLHDFRGYRVIVWHPSQVAYAVIGHSQVPVDTVRLWLLVHVIVAPGALLALAWWAARRLIGRPDDRGRHTGLGS